MKMQCKSKHFTATIAVATALFVGWVTLPASYTAAQEGSDDDIQIEIVNQDGEKVDAAEIQILPKIGKAKAGAGVSVQQKNGKIIITEADGTTREVDVQGAQSVIVNQAVETVVENGEKQTKTFGKAIIIGPDGKRQEIELGGPMQGNWKVPGFNGVFKVDRVSNAYMIGVNCEPVGEALSAQLDLESGVGLVVLNVNTDSPAAAAGIQMHDILMFADDRQLGKQSDLVEAVQTAGKEKTKISLTLIRAGKEIGADVSPVERPANELGIGVGVDRVFGFPDLDGGDFNMKFRRLGPGVIIGGEDIENDFHKQMDQQLQEMRDHMEQLQKQIDEQLKGGNIK